MAHGVRDDVVMATGRSDYPNQVNNVLCFPYIFRGALDVGATTITREDGKAAAVYAIAELAEEEQEEWWRRPMARMTHRSGRTT